MLCNVTVSGVSIPQDPEGNDMCLLFLKYGRCRFKQKCRKSHWVPPIPDDEPSPMEVMPPLPGEGLPLHEKTVNNISTKSPVLDTRHFYPMRMHEKYSTTSHGFQNKQLDNLYLTASPPAANISPPCLPQSETKQLEKKAQMMPRRFTHIFHDNELCNSGCSGIKKMFHEANVYYDRVQEKVMPVNLPQNKAEKQHLKLIRRLHWNYTQQLKEKLSQFPPSFHLKFDRNKVNFNRLRPYIYILIHECLWPDGLTKPVKPSKLAYLVGDTLIAHIDMKYISAQVAERKLQGWGARAVRARQCVDHLWYLMSVCSKNSEGCADEIFNIEQEVIKDSRTALDYAYACYHALGQTRLTTTSENSRHYFTRRVSSPVKQGLEAQETAAKTLRAKSFSRENTGATKQAIDNSTNILHGKTKKKRKRSKQFKNVSLYEKKKLETRCTELLKNLP